MRETDRVRPAMRAQLATYAAPQVYSRVHHAAVPAVEPARRQNWAKLEIVRQGVQCTLRSQVPRSRNVQNLLTVTANNKVQFCVCAFTLSSMILILI